jgi:hypothetical protein
MQIKNAQEYTLYLAAYRLAMAVFKPGKKFQSE